MKKLNDLFRAVESLNKVPLAKILSPEELQEFQNIKADLQNAQAAICSSLDKINQLKPIEDLNFDFFKTNSSLYNSDLIIEELAIIYLEYAKCIRKLMRVDDLICKLWTRYSDHLPIQGNQANA